MFLDIVGFSATCRACTPAKAFGDLKIMFDRITRLVRDHGGTVDRTLGDGLLAYFTAGDTTTVMGSHADRALTCGIAILQTQMEGPLAEGGDNQTPILPVRIGINSGTVYMGDLGDDERRDFTIIGSAVNFGQRLEAACEINRIMIGEDTMAYATQFSADTIGMRRRPIIAKSYQEPVNALEFDPFAARPELGRRFIAAYRAFAQINRMEERLACADASLVMVTTHGYANVVNVSRSGVMLCFDTYIARGDVVHVSQVIGKIEHLDAPPMFLEVRWGTPEPDGRYLHGCLLKNLNDDQKSELWDLWTSILSRVDEDKEFSL